MIAVCGNGLADSFILTDDNGKCLDFGGTQVVSAEFDKIEPGKPIVLTVRFSHVKLGNVIG